MALAGPSARGPLAGDANPDAPARGLGMAMRGWISFWASRQGCRRATTCWSWPTSIATPRLPPPSWMIRAIPAGRRWPWEACASPCRTRRLHWGPSTCPKGQSYKRAGPSASGTPASTATLPSLVTWSSSPQSGSRSRLRGVISCSRWSFATERELRQRPGNWPRSPLGGRRACGCRVNGGRAPTACACRVAWTRASTR